MAVDKMGHVLVIRFPEPRIVKLCHNVMGPFFLGGPVMDFHGPWLAQSCSRASGARFE